MWNSLMLQLWTKIIERKIQIEPKKWISDFNIPEKCQIGFHIMILEGFRY